MAGRRKVVALMGDAAHAVVPFYGQGIDASLRTMLCSMNVWTNIRVTGKIFKNCEEKEKVNGDAASMVTSQSTIFMK
ncbi:MAG: hypothetical protein IPF52_03130 [Saprospiraceae bacterium]|nr:hypothetical protein [Saprospiraceae bacterium]